MIDGLTNIVERFSGKKFFGLILLAGVELLILKSTVDLGDSAPDGFVDIAKAVAIGLPIGFGLYFIGQGVQDAAAQYRATYKDD